MTRHLSTDHHSGVNGSVELEFSDGRKASEAPSSKVRLRQGYLPQGKQLNRELGFLFCLLFSFFFRTLQMKHLLTYFFALRFLLSLRILEDDLWSETLGSRGCRYFWLNARFALRHHPCLCLHLIRFHGTCHVSEF